MKTLSMAFCASVALISVPAMAAPIYSADFNDFSAAPGATGTQYSTGLTVGYDGTVGGFSDSGFHAVHAVEKTAGDWAVMFYNGGNDISGPNTLTSTGTILANDLGVSYTVSFQAAAAVYEISGQRTQAGDGINFLLSNAGGAVATYNYFTPSFDSVAASGNPFADGSFTYIGNGTGAFTLTMSGFGQSDDFAGAIDNLSIAATEAVPEPATWSLMLIGFGAIGGTIRRRVAVRFA